MKAGRLFMDVAEACEVGGLLDRRVVTDRDTGKAVTLREAIFTLGLAIDRADVDVTL